MNVPNPIIFRERVRERLVVCFTTTIDARYNSCLFSLEEKKQASINLEIGIFNFAVKTCKKEQIIRHWSNPLFVLVYTDRLRSIFFNLQQSTFLTDFLFLTHTDTTSLHIRAQEVAAFTHQQLNPEIWTKLIAEKEERNLNKFEKEMKPTTSTLFTCRQCKSNNCSYSQYQTKSGDEAMTIFITCNNCGKNAKIN